MNPPLISGGMWILSPTRQTSRPVEQRVRKPKRCSSGFRVQYSCGKKRKIGLSNYQLPALSEDDNELKRSAGLTNVVVNARPLIPRGITCDRPSPGSYVSKSLSKADRQRFLKAFPRDPCLLLKLFLQKGSSSKV